MSQTDSPKPQETLQGAAAAPGVAIGPAVCLRGHGVEVLRVPIQTSDLDREVERFRAAVRTVEAELEATENRIAETFGTDLASIFHAHSVILRDSSFARRIDQTIHSDRVNAEWAVQAVADDLGEKFAQVKSQHLRERGEDLRDVTRYLLRALAGKRSSPGIGKDFDHSVVVVSHELTPDEVLRLGRRGAVGFAIEVGGANSHTAIVSRALDVPLVTGIVDITNRVADDDPVIVDGEDGRLTLHPTPETLDRYRNLQRRRRQSEEALSSAARDLPARTVDGAEVELLANVELPEELDDVRRFGASGIGLYRSEFLVLDKTPVELPSEEEHVAVVRQLLEALAPQPVVVRTLDLGGGKVARGLVPQDEENPVLGQRGIRLTLARADVFRTQLRALFRAASFGNLRILAPMVTAVEEIRELRRLCDDVCAELEAEGAQHRRHVQLGAMVEVPAAVLIARQLAAEVDFLSIGTNDLIQYTLAVDRTNEHVADLYQPLHPAVLSMIQLVVEAGRRQQVPVALCGEIAASPECVPLLLGLGLRQLSMSPRGIPRVKEVVRSLDICDAEELARRCVAASTAEEVWDLLGEAGAAVAHHRVPVRIG